KPIRLGLHDLGRSSRVCSHSPFAASSPCGTKSKEQRRASIVSDVASVRSTVEEHFPNLWLGVDLGLSTAATLLLKDNANRVAVIYVGGPSAGKTTVASMFERAQVCRTPGKPVEALCHRSDKFSAAAFVSQAANRTTKDLDSVDLLPKIK